MSVFTEISGKTFGAWTAIRRVGSYVNGAAMWECRCKCGSLKNKTLKSLRALKGKGCVKCQQLGRWPVHHRDRLMLIWLAMRARCNNPNSHPYMHYGGRGIKICNEWSDFMAFKQWAENAGYEPHLTIDRKDNNGNYEPDNCRWITQAQQVRNRRNTLYVEIDGKRTPVCELAIEHGIPNQVLRRRIKHGWELERALRTPIRTRTQPSPELKR